MRHEADLKLAGALTAGDEQTFNEFFADYFPRLYRFALTRLESDEEAAADVVQTAMMNGVRSLSNYRGDASMFTWFCQIVRNEINGHYRKLSRSVPTVPQDDESIRPILESLISSDEADPDTHATRVEMIRLIQEVLDCLPGNYGNALEWKYIEGHSVSDIAERLDVTELAAQSLLSRARNAFRDALTQLSPQLARQGV